jgi:hypothetical protein
VVIGDDAGGDAAAPTVTGLQVSPLPLFPDFAATTSDYYVRCAAGNNDLTVTVTTSSGPQVINVTAVPDQEIAVLGQYWIRCLPADFPVITVSHPTPGSAPTPGWYLVNDGTYGVVMDTNGTPVWYTRGAMVANVDSVTKDTISVMPNQTNGAFGWDPDARFDIHALDTTTTSLMAVGNPTDVHELRLLGNGDHLLFTYPLESGVDLTGLQTFGSGQTMADCEIQEVSPTGTLVWSWRAGDHIDPVSESIYPQVYQVNGVTVVDTFHCNSIDVDSSGNLLMSARHTNAVFYIDRTTGKIQWKLGGASVNKDGATYIQVVDDPQTSFNLQHDARFEPNGDISLFDDHGMTPDAGVGRGVEYALDFGANTATVVFQFLGRAQSEREGSFRRYADGESVVGWGYVASDPRIVTEVNASGQDVLDIAFSGAESYRAVKVPLSQLDATVLRATAAR